MSPKKLGKAIICSLLERQVKHLRKKNNFKIVAVAGSVGKTSTKFAIARTLGATKRVLFEEGNYNDRLTVPLVLFGHREPNIFNIFAWINILMLNSVKLREPYPYDIVVLEIGTDGLGQLAKFAYLKPEVSVITAISAEHMEFFVTLDAVAHEELVPLSFSGQSLLNIDDIAAKYLPKDTHFLSYGAELTADYAVSRRIPAGLEGQAVTAKLPSGKLCMFETKLLGGQGAKSALAALAVAELLGFNTATTVKSLAQLSAVPGRMQVLTGKKDSTIIDDTYNASPLAVIAALDVLQSAEAPQRIAILGSMNELGDEAIADHLQVGNACDPKKLDLVVTIGQIAKEALAPAAKKRGCKVVTFSSPYEAGRYVLEHLEAGAVILAKGSQNRVFAEESLKVLLRDPADSTKLVRQSVYWLKIKQAQFGQQ